MIDDYDSEPNITFDDIMADLNNSIKTLFSATDIDGHDGHDGDVDAGLE